MPTLELIPLEEITGAMVANVLDPLKPKPRPASTLRPPNPEIKNVQWELLKPEEKQLLKEFLAQLRKHQPIRITVSHKLATAILVGLNWRNFRPMRMQTALFYANEMLHDHWEETSTGISISEDKTYLINGQHRLTGQELVKKSATYTFHLVSPRAERAEDRGSNRSLKVVTAMEAPIVAAARNMNEHFLHYNGTSSPAVMQEIVEEYKESFDLVTNMKKLKGASIWGTFIYCHGQLETYPTLQRRLESFLEAVANGVMLEANDPAFILREWLNRTSQSNAKDRWEIYYTVIKACYFHIQNRKGIQMEEIEKWFAERNTEKTKVFSGYLELAV